MDIPLVVLDQSRLLRIVESGSLSLREWCWNAAVRTLGLSRASRLLTDDLVNAMCVHGRADFLNWLWDLIVHQMRKAHVLQNWHPQCPFMCLNVIHWWESKVATCAVDLAAFDLQPTPNDAPKLDALFANPYPHRYEPVSVIELGTWIVLSILLASDNLDHLQWYLDHCTPDSPLPTLSLRRIAIIVSRGRADLVEQLWRLFAASTHSPALPTELTGVVKISEFQDVVAEPMVLDYLWEFCARAGVSSSIFTECESANIALDDNMLEAVKWWYAMHRVHGMAFPSAEELGLMKLSPEMGAWIKSIGL